MSSWFKFGDKSRADIVLIGRWQQPTLSLASKEKQDFDSLSQTPRDLYLTGDNIYFLPQSCSDYQKYLKVFFFSCFIKMCPEAEVCDITVTPLGVIFSDFKKLLCKTNPYILNKWYFYIS